MEHCQFCEAPVRVTGVPYWAVHLGQRRMHDSTVEVILAETVLLACERCAGRRDFERARLPSRGGQMSPMYPGHPSLALCPLDPPENGYWWTVAVNREVVQHGFRVTPLDGLQYECAFAVLETKAYTYCDACGAQLDFERISVPLKRSFSESISN